MRTTPLPSDLPTKIKFDESFFEEEERCNFRVTRKRKELWAILLDLWQEFDRVCRKYNLTYYLDGGTLLGAVRHKGFIPWEDDVDVMMTRRDFNTIKYYCENFDNDNFTLAGGECGFYSSDFFAKFFNKRHYCLEENKLLTHPWVDIYVLTEVKRSELDAYLKKLKIILAISSLSHKKVKYDDWYDSELKIWFYHNFHQKEIGSKKFVDKLLYNHLTKYQDSDEADSYILLSPGIFSMADKKTYSKDLFKGYVNMEFEGYTFQVPAGYDEILKICYGENYLTEEPPEKEQVFKHSNHYLREGEAFVCRERYVF